MPKNYTSFISVPYEVGDILVIYRTWLPEMYENHTVAEGVIPVRASLEAKWNEFLKTPEGVPFGQDIDNKEEKKKIDFKSLRITFKITNIYSYGIGREITGFVKWSNVSTMPSGETLTFVLDDGTLRKHRFAHNMHHPRSEGAKRDGNLWRATKGDLIDWKDTETEQRVLKEYERWFRHPVLNNNNEWVLDESLRLPSHGKDTSPVMHIKCFQLKGSDDFFTAEYAVQGKLIEFIKRMARRLKGRTVSKLDEMGYLTLGLRKDRDLTGKIDVSQDVRWCKDSHEDSLMFEYSTNAYFVLSAIGVTSIQELENGARVASTENTNAYEVIMYRSNRVRLTDGLRNTKFRLRMSDDTLYGPNPHIEYMRTGDGSPRGTKMFPEIYGFELRSHNRAEPVSRMTFNLNDKDTNAFIKPTVTEEWIPIKNATYYDGMQDVQPEYNLAEDLEEGVVVNYNACLFIEYKPRSVCIVQEDEKSFKTIYVPTAWIPDNNPCLPIQFETNSQREWGFILQNAFVKKQGLRELDVMGSIEVEAENFLLDAVERPIPTETFKEENIFSLIRSDPGISIDDEGTTATQYWEEKLNQFRKRIDSDSRRTIAMLNETYEPWALKLDPEQTMFKHVCDFPRSWHMLSNPYYMTELFASFDAYQPAGHNIRTAPPKLTPEQSLSIIQLHVATLNAKGEETKYDMMNDPGDTYTRLYPEIKHIDEDNAYLEIHIGELSQKPHRMLQFKLSENILETLNVHMNRVNEIRDAQNHTEELISSRMDMTDKMLSEYPDAMSFSMIHSVLADTNKAIDKNKMIELIEQYVPNSGLFNMSNDIDHTKTIPKSYLNDLIIQEAGSSTSMNLNQSLWDFILYVIGSAFGKKLNIRGPLTIASLRQQVFSFRMTIRDSVLRQKWIETQQQAYTDGALQIKMNQMNEYFRSVSGKTFFLDKLSVADLNKSIGYHLKKNFMHPTQLAALDNRFTNTQNTNYNMEFTLEPQQRRVNNPVEISMVTAVGPLMSKTHTIPSNAWEETYKPSFLRITQDRVRHGKSMAAIEWNKYQPQNRNTKTRDDIMSDAGFKWDNGAIYHEGSGGRLYGEKGWRWVKNNNPGLLIAIYEPDWEEVKALEARKTYLEKEVAGLVEGNAAFDTKDIHEARKAIMRETFKHVRKLETLRYDVYRKVPRSASKIKSDWRAYQHSQYAALRKGILAAGSLKGAEDRDKKIMESEYLTPQQYRADGNSLVGPFQSAEPYTDVTGQPGKMEADFWELTDEDIEVQLNLDNYGKVGYLLNHFIRSRRCHQMDIANKWFNATRSYQPSAGIENSHGLTLEGRFNYLRWGGSGLADPSLGPLPRASTYITKNVNISAGLNAADMKSRKLAFYREINAVYGAETQQFVSHLFKFPAMFNAGIDWRKPPAKVQWFRVTDIEIQWDYSLFAPRLRVQGLANIINNIIHKQYDIVKKRMKERNEKGLDQEEADVRLVGKSSVENLIEKVWDNYSDFEGRSRISMEGRSDYTLQMAGLPDKIGMTNLERVGKWSEMRNLFNVKITLPGTEPAYLYKNRVYVRNFFYVYRLKNKNALKLDFGRIKLEYELIHEKVAQKNYGKLMGMGSLATYHGVDQTMAGLFLPDNLPAEDKFLSKENQYDQGWRLYESHFYSDLVALFEINGLKKTDIPIAESYKAVAVIGSDGYQSIGADGRRMFKMAPIDKQDYEIMGLWRKVETLTAARATQINNSDRVQEAMGKMYEFWNSLPTVDLSLIEDMTMSQIQKHIIQQHQELSYLTVPDDETAETALGIPFTECLICNEPGATVFLGRCSKNKDHPHCYHLSCLYDSIIKNPGAGGTSWQYKAINLDQEMSYITTAVGTMAHDIHQDANFTVREFLKQRQRMRGPNGIGKEQSVTIPLAVDEAVSCDKSVRRWFINAGKNHKRTVCGYRNDDHERGGEWYRDIPMFEWRGLLAGHAELSNIPPFKRSVNYVDESGGGQNYHGTVTMTPNTAKCSACQMKLGSRIMVAIPTTRKIHTTGQFQYAGQEVREYGENQFYPFGNVPMTSDGRRYDFDAYDKQYILMKYEPFGRAEVEGPQTGHGGGSLELHMHDVASYIESRPYKDKNVSIEYSQDKNIPQVLFPTPRLPNLEHPLIRKRREAARPEQRQKATKTKSLYGQERNLVLACLDKARNKDWKENLIILFNKKDPGEGGMEGEYYTDLWEDARGGPWAVYDPQTEQVETSNSNSSTTKRAIEKKIPGSGQVVELPVFASGTGSARYSRRGVYGSNLEPNREDIKLIEKWVSLVEEQAGVIAQQEKDQSREEYNQYVERICAKYECKSLADSTSGLRARFQVLPPGRAVKTQLEFDDYVTLADFIDEVTDNVKPVPTKDTLDIYIPNDKKLVGIPQKISDLCKWFDTPTWPEFYTPEEEDLGTLVTVPIFEPDMELEFPETKENAEEQIALTMKVNKYNKVKRNPDINTIEISKIEYMGERPFPKVYDGRTPQNGILKHFIRKPKLRQKPPGTDQLPWFTMEKVESFMVRTKPKQLLARSNRMKIEIAFVPEGSMDDTIEVNRCNMTMDVPKNLPVDLLASYMIKCRWFQNPKCWKYLDQNGHPALPDGRTLFRLRTLNSSSTLGFVDHPEAYQIGPEKQQLFESIAEPDEHGSEYSIFQEWVARCKISLFGKGNEQHSRDEDDDAIDRDFDVAYQLDADETIQHHLTFQELIEGLGWPGDYEDDEWFWTSDTMPMDKDQKRTYAKLDIPSPYKVSQFKRHNKQERPDPNCTTHGLTILIQIPPVNKYKARLEAGTVYEWNNGANRLQSWIQNQYGTEAIGDTVVANVAFHDFNNGTLMPSKQSYDVPIPVQLLMHKSNMENSPHNPAYDNGEGWWSIYTWANLLNCGLRRTRVFADDRFYTQIGGWQFNGDSSILDRFHIDDIGTRGGVESLAVMGQIRIKTEGTNVVHVDPKRLLMAHPCCQARNYYTLMRHPEEGDSGKTYEEKYKILGVSTLMQYLRPASRLIPLSSYTQPGVKLLPIMSGSDTATAVKLMVEHMRKDGLEPDNHNVDILKDGGKGTGWSSPLTDGITDIGCTLEDFKYAKQNSHKALINKQQSEELKFNPNYELFIDVVRIPPREKRPLAPTRKIGFDFVVVGPHEHRLDTGYYEACGNGDATNNIRAFRGGAVHEMFLPVELNTGPGTCGFGFKDIQWHGFLQELKNMFCAEAALNEKWSIQMSDDKEGWVTQKDMTEERKMQLLLEQISYVGTLILRDDRVQNDPESMGIEELELFHLSPDRQGVPYGDSGDFELSVDERELVSLGISPLKQSAFPSSKLYTNDGQDSDRPNDYLKKSVKSQPIDMDDIENTLHATNGASVSHSRQSENLIFNPKCWSDSEDNSFVYLNRACGVFENTEHTLPLKRGISKDGQGYNIQRALFGVNNSIDGWRNPGTVGDLEDGQMSSPHFVVGVRMKNPEKYRLVLKNHGFSWDPESVYSDDDATVILEDGEDDSEEEESDDFPQYTNDEHGFEWGTTDEVLEWPEILMGDVVALPLGGLYRVNIVNNFNTCNLEGVEDPDDCMVAYPCADIRFIHRAMTYPGRRHEIIRTKSYCRVRMGTMQADGADALQAGTEPWSQNPELSEKIYRIDRFGYGSKHATAFNLVNMDEKLPENDEGPIGESHQIILRDVADYNTQYRTFISVIAFCDNDSLRVFGPDDSDEEDSEAEAEEEIMGHYTYENSNREIKRGDIVMYENVDLQTAVITPLQTLRQGTRFNAKDPREYSVVDISENGENTQYIIKLTMWTTFYDTNFQLSKRILGVHDIPMIQFKREGFLPITMAPDIAPHEPWRQMPCTVGALIRRTTRTGAYLNQRTWLITGTVTNTIWQGHYDGGIVSCVPCIKYGDIWRPDTDEDEQTVNVNFLRWVGYQGATGLHFPLLVQIGQLWQSRDTSGRHEVIAVHRALTQINQLSNQIETREALNCVILLNRYAGYDVDNSSFVWKSSTGIDSDMIQVIDRLPGHDGGGERPVEYGDTTTWPRYISWSNFNDSAHSSVPTSESDEDVQFELDSRLSKITLKF